MKLFLPLFLFAGSTLAAAQTFDPANFKQLEWTNVGPNRGGRSIACTGVRTRPKEYYFGATGGGVWKTTDAGATWNCVSDGFFGSSSVGAIAVSDSNPDIVFAGTGEREIRGDISEGDGLYKSIDGGKTWARSGLEDTRTISKIVIDPKNPKIVYVAALGHIYGPNAERGVFKSTDGGASWTKVLFESDRAGAVELVMDPTDSRTLYAATWEAWRTPYKLSSGGAGSKFFKSIDAGATWKEITRNPGLPQGTIGKIGVSVSAANPKRLYAIVEAADGGIYRSDDAGGTWQKVNDSPDYRQRAWYFSHVIADPKTTDKLYCLNVGNGKSSDAGKTWSGFSTPHSDNHDLWINPDDPQTMIEANDGGAAVSTNGGATWTKEACPTAQLYHVAADSHIPYRIYGAQQDSSAVRLQPGQPTFDNTAGGESGYITPNTANWDIVYGGNYSGDISEIDYRTNLRHRIDPWPENPMGHPAKDLTHRIQWTFPIVTSPHDPNVLYTASQYVLRTRNDGQSWERISPDLTRNDLARQGSSGGPLTQDNTSVEYYDTVFTVAESPVRKGVIWAGSDDGLVHVTTSDGHGWADVTPPGMPHWGRVSMIEPSPHDAASAYVAVNDYQSGDLKPYIYRTHDFGRTWTLIVNGIAPNAFARVCREDLHRAGLLYAGTETGAYVSFDDGSHWQSLQKNLPLCPVHDLLLKDDDLIAATHGRSFWIMHSVSRLAELTGSNPTHPMLYAPIDQMRLGGARAHVDYFLPVAAKSVSFEFYSQSGEKLATTTGETGVGFHDVEASLSHRPFGTFPGMVLWSGFARPIPAPPGLYSVRMVVDGYKDSKPFRLTRDPRVTASLRDLDEQYAFAVTISERTNEANGAVMRIRATKEKIDKAVAEIGKQKIDGTLPDRIDDTESGISSIKQAAALKEKLTEIEGEIHQYRSKSGEDPLNYPVKLNDQLAGLMDAVLSGSMRPPKQTREIYAKLSRSLQVQLDALKHLEANELESFNRSLKAKGIAAIVPVTPELTTATRRRGGGEEEERERERGEGDDN